MDLTIDQLLKGKNTIIKSNEYLSTEQYVTPFLELVHDYTESFIIKAETPKQMTVTDDDTDITYNRVWVQAVLKKDYGFENHKEVIGFLYGLDTKKPIVKFYKGGLNMACTNLCIFNPEMLHVQLLEPESRIDYKPLKQVVKVVDDVVVTLKKMSNIFIDTQDVEDLERELGRWNRNALISSYNNGASLVKVGEGIPNKAFKDLFLNQKSKYYRAPDKTTTLFDVYNAFTDLISNDNRDIINKAEKTLILKDILGV